MVFINIIRTTANITFGETGCRRWGPDFRVFRDANIHLAFAVSLFRTLSRRSAREPEAYIIVLLRVYTAAVVDHTYRQTYYNDKFKCIFRKVMSYNVWRFVPGTANLYVRGSSSDNDLDNIWIQSYSPRTSSDL